MSSREKVDAKLHRMTTDPVEKLVCRMAAPSIVIMLITAMYNMADTYFVGTLGTSSTAAVGVSFSLMALIQALGFFFGHGAGNYISRQLGARNYENASRMAVAAFILMLSIGVLIGGAGLLCIEKLTEILGSTPTIKPEAIRYLRFILIGTPWMAGAFFLNNILRFQGSAFYGMIGMITGAVLNVLLDPLFIFVLDLGVAGASLATMISQFVSFCLLFAGCTRGGNIAIRLRNLSPRASDCVQIVRGGFPSLCRQGLMSVAVVVLNRKAGVYGDAAIAAMSVVQRIYWMAGAALIGLGQGFQPVCGINYGARLFGRVRRAFFFCLKTSTLALVALGALGIVFAPQLVERFRDDPEVVAIGSAALRYQCLVMPLAGWVIINNMMLQTIGKAGPATLLALARQGLFMLPLLILLTRWLGLTGVEIAQPCADVLTFLLALPLGIREIREMGRNGDRTAPDAKPDTDIQRKQHA